MNRKDDFFVSRCIVCGKIFQEGDHLHAFLASPEDPGSWTPPVTVDSGFSQRVNKTRCHVIGVR